MQILRANSPKQVHDFLSVVNLIYQNDSNYVRPLDGMVEEVFSEKQNPLFLNGKATRFVAYDQSGRPTGRIAAFINGNKAYGYDQPTGGIGFFECIDDQATAFALFDTAKKWLADQGMEAMDGPINFGENVDFWGLLVEGFTQPAFGMQYNPPYYRTFFEQYGFATYYEQITNHLNLKKPFPERFWRIAERLIAKPEFEFRHFEYAKGEEFVRHVVEIYNDAWRFHDNFTPTKPEHIRTLMQKARPFLMEELIWFAYHNGEPVAFLVMFPDVNQIIRHFNGKIGFWGKIKFLILKQQKTMTRTRVTALGVKAHFQRMGVESGLFYQLRDVVARNPHISEMELSWVGDFNPKMRALQEAMESVFGKRHITYRYLFDEKKRQNFQRVNTISPDTKEKIKKRTTD
ncbi:MAG: GNAT family N-acetyltransferase [Breznakibacter sp.]